MDAGGAQTGGPGPAGNRGKGVRRSFQWLKARGVENTVLMEGLTYGLAAEDVKESQEAEWVCRGWSWKDPADQGQELGFWPEPLERYQLRGPLVRATL